MRRRSRRRRRPRTELYLAGWLRAPGGLRQRAQPLGQLVLPARIPSCTPAPLHKCNCWPLGGRGG
jgi:hypothetical protein